jgi:Rod binding domain-containing protein
MSGTIGSVPILPPATRTIPAARTTDATAQKFEAMAIAQFLKPIFETMGKADAPFGGGTAARQFQPFLIDAIAKSMEARGGLGLTPMIKTTLAGEQAKQGPAPAFRMSTGVKK